MAGDEDPPILKPYLPDVGIAVALGEEFPSATGGTVLVHGHILEYYRQNNAQNGIFGRPLAEQQPWSERGSVEQRFEFGAIFWSKQQGYIVVIGRIYEKWRAGDFGGPTSAERSVDSPKEHYRYQVFERRYIFAFDGDAVVYDVGDIEIAFAGILCFTESPGMGSDEPYVIFSLQEGFAGRVTSVTRTRIFDDVDAGESRREVDAAGAPTRIIYRGLPLQVRVWTSVWEHDNENPDTILNAVAQRNPPDLAGYRAISDAFIDGSIPAFTARELILKARSPLQHVKDITFTAQTSELRGHYNQSPAWYEVFYLVHEVAKTP